MNLLEELWYGNIYPNEQSIRKDSEYAQALHKVVDEKESLRKQLQAEQDSLTALRKQYDKKRPAIHAHVQALTAELDRLENEVDEIIMAQLQTK